jgi:glutamate synthase (NADPH/NADH) small chain
LGRNLQVEELRSDFDAVFLSVGMGVTPGLGIPGEEHIVDGLAYIERSKMDPAMTVGRHVVVVGAGNTAVDCATIAKRLGAERVTMVYRRTDREMTAYPHEYEFVKKEGVEFRFLAQPVRVVMNAGKVAGLACMRMALGNPDASGRPWPEPVAGSEFVVEADEVVKAIGQEKPWLARLLGVETEKGYIKVSGDFETSVAGVYAGGDCIRARGAASTVMAVEDGKLAAAAIRRASAGR